MDFFDFFYFLVLKIGAFVYFFHDKQPKEGEYNGESVKGNHKV